MGVHGWQDRAPAPGTEVTLGHFDMVILGRELKPTATDAPRAPGGPVCRLAGCALAAPSGLGESVAFYNSAFNLQLLAALDVEPVPRAVMATGTYPARAWSLAGLLQRNRARPGQGSPLSLPECLACNLKGSISDLTH